MMLLFAFAATAIRMPTLGRRELLGITAAASPALAYDSVPEIKPDFDALEKKRLERAALAEKNAKRLRPYVKQITDATDAASFAEACDKLALWVIQEGSLPEGINPVLIRDAISDAYNLLPQKAYACEKTRTNDGICFQPGEPADSACERFVDPRARATPAGALARSWRAPWHK